MGLFFDGGGFAFLDVVFVPGGNFGDVGAGLFDDALAAEAGVELEAWGELEAVELEVFGFRDALGTLLQKDVAGGAGGDATAGVVEEDAVVFGDVEEGHGLAVAVVGEGAEGELDGFVFRLEGDANEVLGGWLGEVDFWESDFVIRHSSSSLVRAGGLCRARRRRWRVSETEGIKGRVNGRPARSGPVGQDEWSSMVFGKRTHEYFLLGAHHPATMLQRYGATRPGTAQASLHDLGSREPAHVTAWWATEHPGVLAGELWRTFVAYFCCDRLNVRTGCEHEPPARQKA